MPLAEGFLGDYSQTVSRAVVDYEGLTREGSASRLIHVVVAGVISLQDVGLNASVLCWLLARDHRQFFSIWAHLIGSLQHGTWHLAFLRGSEQEYAEGGGHFFFFFFVI